MNKTKLILRFIVFFLLFTAFKKTNLNSGSSTGISIGNVSVVEGNNGQRNAEIMVILGQPVSKSVSVNYATRDGSATSGSDYVATNGTVTFSVGERMKKIAIPIIGDVTCEPNETFEIVLDESSETSIDRTASTVTIINDDCGDANLAIYEVRFTYTGYTTFGGTPTECKIRSNGEVVLYGLLSGYEKVSADDDVVYTGELQLEMDIDICSTSAIEDARGGYPLCGMTVLGSGLVNTELDIYYDHRGGYIKTEDETGEFTSVVFGSCDQQQKDEEKDMVPNNTISSVFNGTELSKLTMRTLQVGRYVDLDGGIEIVVEVIRKIR